MKTVLYKIVFWWQPWTLTFVLCQKTNMICERPLTVKIVHLYIVDVSQSSLMLRLNKDKFRKIFFILVLFHKILASGYFPNNQTGNACALCVLHKYLQKFLKEDYPKRLSLKNVYFCMIIHAICTNLHWEGEQKIFLTLKLWQIVIDGRIILVVVNRTTVTSMIISNLSILKFANRKTDHWENYLLYLHIVILKITKQRQNYFSHLEKKGML